ncbi:MAG: hypothetical protein Fur0032_00410 [Terrimicrobiaceae bacterium]
MTEVSAVINLIVKGIFGFSAGVAAPETCAPCSSAFWVTQDVKLPTPSITASRQAVIFNRMRNPLRSNVTPGQEHGNPPERLPR